MSTKYLKILFSILFFQSFFCSAYSDEFLMKVKFDVPKDNEFLCYVLKLYNESYDNLHSQMILNPNRQWLYSYELGYCNSLENVLWKFTKAECKTE